MSEGDKEVLTERETLPRVVLDLDGIRVEGVALMAVSTLLDLVGALTDRLGESGIEYGLEMNIDVAHPRATPKPEIQF